MEVQFIAHMILNSDIETPNDRSPLLPTSLLVGVVVIIGARIVP